MDTRILIVDDEGPARLRLRTLLDDIRPRFANTIIGEADSGKTALSMLGQSPADLVLLDVQMPGMDGIELARHLTLLAERPAIIFVTAFDEYAVKAFEVYALDYLLKPVRAERLLAALARIKANAGSQSVAIEALGRQNSQYGRQHLSVHERGKVILIAVEEIIYLKAEMKYVTIRTREREYLTEEPLVGLEEEFAPRFVRVHRNALVARHAVKGFERIDGAQADDASSEAHWQVVLREIPERLPISRRQWPIVKVIVRS